MKRSLLALLASALVLLPLKASLAEPITTQGVNGQVFSSLTNTLTQVGAAGVRNLTVIDCWNPNSFPVYIQAIDGVAGSLTLGTSVPKLSPPIDPTSTGGFSLSLASVKFNLGLTIAATTTATGNVAPTTPLSCTVVFN